ncbi:MAG TPA: hypothetical protein PKL97_01960 [Candidatus Omnitrophota bacterium]|nr:hypothetical protein [Candidatus Omnitrophota bacterium]
MGLEREIQFFLHFPAGGLAGCFAGFQGPAEEHPAAGKRDARILIPLLEKDPVLPAEENNRCDASFFGLFPGHGEV